MAPSISRSSASVRSRNGDISLQSTEIEIAILAKCLSEHGLFMSTSEPGKHAMAAKHDRGFDRGMLISSRVSGDHVM